MPRFIAIHPAAFPEEQLKPLAAEKLPEGVTWHSTYCAFADDKTYCHWEAPTKEALIEVFTKYEIPCEAVYEVRWFDPATAQFEPEVTRKEVLAPA